MADQKNDRIPPNLYRYMGIGMECALAVIVMAGVGLWIDHRYETQPWGILIGALLGIAGGMYLLIKTALRLGK